MALHPNYHPLFIEHYLLIYPFENSCDAHAAPNTEG